MQDCAAFPLTYVNFGGPLGSMTFSGAINFRELSDEGFKSVTEIDEQQLDDRMRQ